MRWEWYPRTGEILSTSLFYKYFDRLIEKIILPATEPATSWRNAESAFNYGAEFEVRKNLDFLAPTFSNFSITGNLALIRSQVELGEGGIETSRKRALQGQSPYILNLMASYDNQRSGTAATILYNVFGERISEAGISGTPDIYEQPLTQLDFVLRQSLANKLAFKLTLKNLLDPEVKFEQGDRLQRAYKRGRSVSLSLSYDFL